MFFRSIRSRFISWYTLIQTVTLVAFGLIIHAQTVTILREGLDDLLQSRTEGVAASINTYWRIEEMEALDQGIAADVFNQNNNENFVRIARRWVENESNDPGLMNLVIRIYKPDGEIIATTKRFPLLTPAPQIIDHRGKNRSHFETRLIKVNNRQLPFRICTTPVLERKKIAYIVQVASPMTSIAVTARRLKLLLFILLPLTVLITSVVAGEFLASITLKPLQRMIKTVRQITAENMKLRVQIPETRDEIQELAGTFNDMLDKINASFMSQRQFIQDISHELRTPLTILKGELDVALKKNRSRGEYLSLLHSNLEEIDKINRIVDNLLTLARFDNNEINLRLEHMDMVPLARAVMPDIELMAAQKKITVQFTAPDHAPLIADGEKLRRVLLNLIDNAVKYTPAGGRIGLEINADPRCVTLKVSDSGIGINPDDLPFIFDRFYRADKSRSDAGFGLGLSIVKSIVTAHRGTIAVSSSPGAETIFTIILPANLTIPPDALFPDIKKI